MQGLVREAWASDGHEEGGKEHARRALCHGAQSECQQGTETGLMRWEPCGCGPRSPRAGAVSRPR